MFVTDPEQNRGYKAWSPVEDWDWDWLAHKAPDLNDYLVIQLNICMPVAIYSFVILLYLQKIALVLVYLVMARCYSYGI